MRTPLGQTGAGRVPWGLVAAVVLFGGGLVFASVAIGHRLDDWDGTYTTSGTYDTHRALHDTSRHLDQLLFRGAVTTAVLLALTSPFLVLRRRWAAVVTTCLAVASVPMAFVSGALEPGSPGGREPYSDSDWASFCSLAAAPTTVVGAVGALVVLVLHARRDRPAPRQVDRA